MEQIYFGQRIAALRKERGLTQEALAQKLGITNQAVSKWESDQCCPDIMQLPVLADIFEISMDTLFGRETPTEEPKVTGNVEGLPWEDNNDLHAVCYVGHRLVSYKEIPAVGGKRDRFGFSFSCMGFEKNMNQEPIQLVYSGSVGSIYSDYSVTCTDSTIQGSIHAGDSIRCGDVGGNVYAGDDADCSGSIGGNVQAGDSVQCDGSIGGSVTAGGDVDCAEIGGKVQCEADLSCRGNISGDVRASGDVECSGDIGGSVDAQGDVDCAGSIYGNVSCEGDVACSGDITGNINCAGDVR